METTSLAGLGEVILTEGMVDGATGRRIYGVFASPEDARSPKADELAIATVSEADLTAEQSAMAARNSESL